ncbi:GTPase [Aquimarina sp. 2304DJ70-9]|uniref:GTPase n=1 Tax=Aquimarina penaris TaxID=3231044 RepID=UPI003463792F
MKTLTFVYNAKSDYWNKQLDGIHKIISPSTYSCDLCSLTHGNFSEKKIWKDFKQNSGLEIEFMYKNEFEDAYPNIKEFDFPMILQKDKNTIEVLFDSKKIASLESTEELIKKLQKKMLPKTS